MRTGFRQNDFGQNNCEFAAHLFTTVALFLVATTVADTHYVDIKSSSPKAPYTSWETAANRIQDAVEAAGNGDTVLVGDGTYNITSQIHVRRSLTVRSANGRDATTIDANGNCRVVRLESKQGSITFEGFTITGGYGNFGGGISANGASLIRISNCIVEDNEAKTGGGMNLTVGKGKSGLVTIEHCIVRNNRSNGHYGGINVSMWEKSTGSITIENCVIYRNRSNNQIGGVGSLYGSEPKDIKVVNCTIVENESQTSHGGVKNVKVYNSIICNNTARTWGHDDIGEGCKAFNSCSSEPSSSRAGNIRGKPRFVNARKGDFRLMPGSPCIDAGSNLQTNLLVDLDGNPRIVDGNRDGDAVVDMGAYEFQVIAVEIDIKPGSKSKSINLKARGLLPVAILTTKTFDAASVNPSSLQFADAKPVRRMLQDVDADGDVDLLLQFKRQKLNLTADSTKAFLTGQTRDKHPFIGEAEIKIVPGK